MKQKLLRFHFIVLLFFSCAAIAQDVSLLQQFNGRYDFTFIGNTLNLQENGLGFPCNILTSSTATLQLNSDDEIEKAYLYWAGSGTGDLNVKLNNHEINAERTFSTFNTNLYYFSAFAEVTSLLQNTGNGDYTLSDLDLTAVIANNPAYCANGTNFGGWAILIIYKNESLPLNQLNIYDGLQHVPNELNITLTSLNVIDNENAKIGFIAWEGDRNIAVNETLKINGIVISNPPLNPANNAFNGTNSVTGMSNLYNMDLDIYNIQNTIQVGDQTAHIQLTSGQDFVMINTVITKLNSQLPDATVTINEVATTCDSKTIEVDYTINNTEATQLLPAHTPISIYINANFAVLNYTNADIPVGGSETHHIVLVLDDTITADFDITVIVDQDENGNGTVVEINEDNNVAIAPGSLKFAPGFTTLPNLRSCNLGLKSGIFDFSGYEDLVKTAANQQVFFYESHENAETGYNPITEIHQYHAVATPKEIFVRVENEDCFSITSFQLDTKNCPPTVYNAVSPNGDGLNDTFFIDGLRDIFLNFELFVYNRWGILVWQGNNNTPDWDGVTTKGIVIKGNDVPAGTYFYVLELNDPDYSNGMSGYLYLSK